MTDSHKKIAKILRTSPEIIYDLDQKMSGLTGQEGVIESVAAQNHLLISKTLSELSLSNVSKAEDIYTELIHRLVHIDQHLYELLGRPDLLKMSVICGKFCETALQIYKPPMGLFIKKEKVAEFLEKDKPQNILDFFGYPNVKDLLDKEGFSSVVSALRFTQNTEWMHRFFDQAYDNLKPDDFEERDVELKILDEHWLSVAEKFIEKKYHNVSHLKEYGVIFIIPLKIDSSGETLRVFTLMLHYLHEVPFYSNLFRRFMPEKDFISKFKSLLRGDVPEGKMPGAGKFTWRIIQRYLAKDDENDFRLFEPHVNPEADHWLRVGEDLVRLSRILGGGEGKLDLGYWFQLDHVGDFFPSINSGQATLVSFDLIDLIMSLVKRGQIKYLYHQQEALWNEIFSEYMGREKMNELIEENIIKGFIEL